MATNQPQETRTSIDEVNDALTGIGQKVQSNPKVIVWSCVAVCAVVAIILIWIFGIRQPGQKAGANALGQADMELIAGNDSIALEKYKQVAANHGYAAGNNASLNAAILLYSDGKYEEALSYLKKYSASESIIGASAKSLEGDCYVNLKKYPEAVDCFKQAVKLSDKNPHYTPAFLMKEATVLHELKDYKAEADIYQQIVDEYPSYGQEIGVDIRKYLERAQDAAASK